MEGRDLHPDELPEPARPRLRPVGPRHRVRRDRRPAVLRPVVLDEEVLPGHGDAPGAEAGIGARSGRSAAPTSSRAATSPTRCRATCSCSIRSASGACSITSSARMAQGSSRTEVDPILQSADENFRPVDAEVGPDGALYFVDWHNPIIGHMQHNLRDTTRDRLHGRVYPRDLPRPAAADARQDCRRADPRLLDLLKEPEDRVRYRAKIELSARDTKEVVAALQALDGPARSEGPTLRAPHDGGAVGSPVAQPRERPSCSPACCGRASRGRALRRRASCATGAIASPDALTLLKVQANDEHPARPAGSRQSRELLPGTRGRGGGAGVVEPSPGSVPRYTLDQAMNTLKAFVK